MRLLLGFIFVIGTCALGLIQNNDFVTTFDTFSQCKVCLKSVGDIDKDGIVNGDNYILTLTKEDIYNYTFEWDNVVGVTLKITDISFENIVKKIGLKIVDTYYIGDNKVVVGYAKRLNNNTGYMGKYNIQMVIYPDYILIGYPLIMQGF